MRNNQLPEARRQPVIVLGMHRSGTSMLVGLLRNLGLEIGANTPRNNESKLFRRLNLWLIKQVGGHWDNPSDIDKLLELPELRSASDEYLAHALSGLRARDYLGWIDWLRYRSLFAYDKPWGWKDPVNTFTLPFWLDLFPDAKVVHIYRNGVDIAYSMHKRTHYYFNHRYSKWKRLPFYYQLKPLLCRFTSIHTWRLDDCMQLWQDYFDRAQRQVDALPAERTFTLQYEKFLADPAPTLARLTEFCGLDVAESDIHKCTQNINANRAYAFMRNPEKRDSAIRHQDMLSSRGYDIAKLLD